MTTQPATGIADAEDVLDFWFADATSSAEAIERRNRVWFRGGPEFDRECTERFATTLAAAARGELNHWKESPRGRLALIVLLDQFSRNVYRGTAAAFAQDDRALAACREGIDIGHDKDLAPIERRFFYMPLEHAEDRDVQVQAIRQFEALADEAPQELRKLLDAGVCHARQHKDIVDTFQRFPHRNAVLGRENTPAEEAYLADDAPRFGQ